MKKVFSILIILFISFICMHSNNVYAETLNSLNIEVDKEVIHPGEEVNINIDFGVELSKYNVSIAYDNKLFDYISIEGKGDVTDNGNVVTIKFPVEGSGTATPKKLSIKFKAKNEILTTDPTDFSITLQELVNGNTFEDIENPELPTKKNVIVEPVYTSYKFSFKYDGDIIENEEKNMKIILKSEMGKNYENTRIILEAITPEDGNVKMLAIDNDEIEYDIIKTGWGNEKGDPIGGKNIVKEMNVRSIFSKKGKYSVKLKLIDKNNSDSIIASEIFDFEVLNKKQEIVENNNEKQEENKVLNDEEKNIKPTSLPKAGRTDYFIIIPTISLLITAYCILKKKENNKQ